MNRNGVLQFQGEIKRVSLAFLRFTEVSTKAGDAWNPYPAFSSPIILFVVISVGLAQGPEPLGQRVFIFCARATDGEEGGWRDGEGRASESVAERVAQGGLGWVLSLSHPSCGILDKLLRPSNPSVSAPGKRDTHLFGLTSASFLRGQWSLLCPLLCLAHGQPQ